MYMYVAGLCLFAFGMATLAMVTKKMKPTLQAVGEFDSNPETILNRRIQLISKHLISLDYHVPQSSDPTGRVMTRQAFEHLENHFRKAMEYDAALVSYQDALFVLKDLHTRKLADDSDVEHFVRSKSEYLGEALERQLNDLRQTPPIERGKDGFSSETAYLMSNTLEYLMQCECDSERCREKLKRIWPEVKGLASATKFNFRFAQAVEADLRREEDVHLAYHSLLCHLAQEKTLDVALLVEQVLKKRIRELTPDSEFC